MDQNFLKKFLVKYSIPERDAKIVSELYEYDPSTNKKYLYWMYNIFKEDLDDIKHFNDEKWGDVNRALIRLDSYPDRFKNIGLSTDIFTYESVEDLIIASEKAYQRQSKKIFLKNNIDLVDEFNGILILYPSTAEASCYYGLGTRWCITDEGTYYDYMERGDLFFILNKSSNGDDYKTAIYVDIFNKVEGFNSKDDRMGIVFDDIEEIEYESYSKLIKYPRRVLISIRKFLKNTDIEKPGQKLAKVFGSWVKTLGSDYTASIINIEDSIFALQRLVKYKYNYVGTYRVFDSNTLNDYILNEFDGNEDGYYESDRVEKIVKSLGEDKILTYFDLECVFNEMLIDDTKFTFFDDYNIEEIDSYRGLQLTPELIILKEEFMNNPVRFYNENIFKGMEEKKPRFTNYVGIEGMIFYFDHCMDKVKFLKNHPLLLVDVKSDPIVWEYQNKQYFIVNIN